MMWIFSHCFYNGNARLIGPARLYPSLVPLFAEKSKGGPWISQNVAPKWGTIFNVDQKKLKKGLEKCRVWGKSGQRTFAYRNSG